MEVKPDNHAPEQIALNSSEKMNLFDKKRTLILTYGAIIICIIGILAFTDVWSAYVTFVVNILKNNGIKTLPIGWALFLTFSSVYAPVFFVSFYLGRMVRPYLVDRAKIQRNLGKIGSDLEEASKYIRNMQSEITRLVQERDDIKEEILVLEQIKEENRGRLGHTFEIKLRDRMRDKLFSQVQAFIYGVLASLVASYVYQYLANT
jgi:hypothetical protein